MWLVIGYGSSLHSDDGFGRAVADLLERQILPDNLQVMSVHQLRPELVEPICNAGGVIFVDATNKIEPGVLQRLSIPCDHVARKEGSTVFSHSLAPEELLKMAKTLGEKSPPAWLYLIGGENFDLGENLSLKVQRMVPEVAAQILKQIGLPNVVSGLAF